MIRVLIVDDHHVVRAGLQQLIGAVEDFEVVGAARNGSEALDLAATGLARRHKCYAPRVVRVP